MKEDQDVDENGRSVSQSSRANGKRRLTIVERMRLNWARAEKIAALEIIGDEMQVEEGNEKLKNPRAIAANQKKFVGEWKRKKVWINVQDKGLVHDPWLPFENLVIEPPYCLVKNINKEGEEELHIEVMGDQKLKLAEKPNFSAIEDNQMAKQIGRWAHPYSKNVNKTMVHGEQFTKFEDFQKAELERGERGEDIQVWKRPFGELGRGQCNVDYLNSRDNFSENKNDYDVRAKSAA